MKRRSLVHFLLPYWRLRRGMTLGVQGIVIKNGSEVLLVRHGYQPGWHFPGGGVEWRETLQTALAREVQEETGIVVQSEPEFHGIFANFQLSPSDHIAVFVIRHWGQPNVPAATFEIMEQRFFALNELPEDIAGGARRRLAEIFEGQPLGQLW